MCLDTCKKKKASWPIPNPNPPLHQLAQRRRDAADQRCLFSLLLTSLSCCDKLNIHDESFRPRGEELIISVIMESRALSPRDGGWGERGGKTSGLAGAYSVGGGGGSGVERKKIIEESGDGGRGGSAEEGRISFLRMMMTTVTRLLEQKKQQSAVCKDGGEGWSTNAN